MNNVIQFPLKEKVESIAKEQSADIIDLSKYRFIKATDDLIHDLTYIKQVFEEAIELLQPFWYNYSARTLIEQMKRHNHIISVTILRYKEKQKS